MLRFKDKLNWVSDEIIKRLIDAVGSDKFSYFLNSYQDVLELYNDLDMPLGWAILLRTEGEYLSIEGDEIVILKQPS